MPPKSKESPMIDLDNETLATVPFAVGEKVALKEDHDNHPGMYGLIQAIGFDPEKHGICLDVNLIDPFDGVINYENPTVRLSMKEIQ